jgi:hypothetical protein
MRDARKIRGLLALRSVRGEIDAVRHARHARVYAALLVHQPLRVDDHLVDAPDQLDLGR